MSQAKILVIDDDLDLCTLLQRFLSRKGYEVVTAHSGAAGIAAAEAQEHDLAITDFRLGDMDGTQLLAHFREHHPALPVLVMTGYSDIRTAVNVMKQGALDYITKPIVPDEILLSIQRALVGPKNDTAYAAANSSTAEIEKTKPLKPKPSNVPVDNGYIIGQSPLAQALYKQIDLVAPTNYSVIIYGESGAGKESVARMIHDRSSRKNQHFVAMDCGAISKDLANSELFGHEKGAFTGALQTKIGHFELANGGTIFLDEVANLPYDVQVSLLRVVQERRVKRIGGTKEIALDVRIIIASNERLMDACRKGKFREDLYHRFNEFSIEMPALRERREDIVLFALQFLRQTALELNRELKGFTAEVEQIFMNYPWYGNIRELKNVIKRAALLTDGPWVESKSLPFEIAYYKRLGIEEGKDLEPVEKVESLVLPPIPEIRPAAIPLPTPVPETPAIPAHTDLKSIAQGAEYQMIMQVLYQTRFNKSKAAQLLGIDRKTLYNKLRIYNIK
ncbi:sigma-54-dependent transcriptional regulator [Haliscomenobacter hydrossis]|uniref:Two component, sigma54 specific, transcriptional regulator, Fis family n=1 Tax=Haliscomenobacter hydrossis (strain ATCC 27775 / DSM 1100 / LMG 10767 / O) TaxID=760192 RepID=F4L0M4_HALH1|nr:sigma-54 dependent transcriptional regulator [Haliscomenobacter hydrossis]AEE49506.1 two component, sigma54 specific, transcriptional regulator, Fis family [Haliscomenobacter hydrossis DSM 1100]